MKKIKSGIIVKQRDIVLIPFPYSNLSGNKKRPVLVLSNSDYHKYNHDIICCAITSKKKDYFNSINIKNNDLEQGKLIVETKIKPNKIFTINRSLIIKKLCRINTNKSKEVIINLNELIKLEI